MPFLFSSSFHSRDAAASTFYSSETSFQSNLHFVHRGVVDTWPNIRGRHQVCVYSLFTFCLSALLLVNPSLTCHCTQHFTVSYVVQSPDAYLFTAGLSFRVKKPEPSRAAPALFPDGSLASPVRVTCMTRHATLPLAGQRPLRNSALAGSAASGAGCAAQFS